MKMNKMREEMSQAFIQALKEEQIPWHKGWVTNEPLNAATNTTYRGMNRFWLNLVAELKGFDDPRWCTFNQAQNNGWNVKKGEKGTKVEFWSMYDTETKRKLTSKEADLLKEQLGKDYYSRVKPISNVYTVFNAQQMEGVPEWEKNREPLKDDDLLAKRDVILKNMKLELHEGGNRAFYDPSEDFISLPSTDQFKNSYEYMSTFLHEAAHATGHESRLNRNLEGVFGTAVYAKEELRAEIAAAFTSQELELGQSSAAHMENHKAYIQSWIEILERKPQELFDAIRDAENISDYLIEKGDFLPDKKRETKLDARKQQFVADHKKELEKMPMEKTPLVINAFGGPGSGKTTTCMDICQQLKKLGYNAEYVQEYAKELVYDKNWELLDGSEVHQFEMLKEQMHRMDRLYGQTDFIVTDSPILLNTIYNQELTPEYSRMVQDLHGQYQNFSYFVERDRKSFQQEGRIHNLEESLQKDNEIKRLLKENGIYYGTYSHENIEKVVKNAVTTYNHLNQKGGREQNKSEEKQITEEILPEAGMGFDERQRKEILLGREKGLDVSMYAKPEFDHEQMKQIRLGLENGVDIKMYADPGFGWLQMDLIRHAMEANLEAGMYADPGFTPQQMEIIRQGLEQGIDASIYAKPEYSWQQMDKIRQGLEKGLDVSIYAKPEYNQQQMDWIRIGLENDVDVSIYAKPEYSWQQMVQLYLGIKDDIDVSTYADPKYEEEQMRQIRLGLEKNTDAGIYADSKIDSIQMEMKDNLEQRNYMSVSDFLAAKLWENEVSLFVQQDGQLNPISSRKELYEMSQGKKDIFADKHEFSEKLQADFFPTVTCVLSELGSKVGGFDEGKTYMVSEFSETMRRADQEWIQEKQVGYAKVKFEVNLENGQKIIERQDVGDGNGSMIEFLKSFSSSRYQQAVKQLGEAIEEEQGFMRYQDKLNGFFGQENCQENVMQTLQKQINQNRHRQTAPRGKKPGVELG